MIDIDEIFLNILIELNFILLYCINRITPGHIIQLSHFLQPNELQNYLSNFVHVTFKSRQATKLKA